MIWSVLRITLFILVVAATAFGVGWVIEHGSEVQLVLGGVEISLTPLAAIIGGLTLIVAVWLALRLGGLALAVWHFLRGDETALSRYFDRSRERRGFAALTEAMMALASGDAKAAMREATRAEKLLRRPELTTLVVAQAAEAAGDRTRAIEAYKKLVADRRTRFVGVHGLMKAKLAEGDTDTALKLAEKAFALKPRHGPTLDALLKLQSQKGDWGGARRTLAGKLRAGMLPRDVHTRRDAVLALAEARRLAEQGEQDKADALALEAQRHSPTLIPAAVMAARAAARKGNIRSAAAMLRKAWAAQPHPDIAAAYAALVPDETPAARLRRFAPLLKINPDHPETRMLRAELALAAEDFPEAARAMGDLAETHPTLRALTIMAAIAKGMGEPEKVIRAWLARAVEAPRGPQWICSNCHHIHAQWAPVCENCHAVDTLDWAEPPQDAADDSAPRLLPLIAGLLEDSPSGDTPDATEGDGADAPAAQAPEGVAKGREAALAASEAARDVSPEALARSAEADAEAVAEAAAEAVAEPAGADKK